MFKFFSSRKTLVMILTVACMVMAMSALAFANSSNGTEFQSLYDRVMGWVTGIPAIIIAMAFAIMGIVKAFKEGFMWALGGLLVAAFIFLIPTIVAGLGGATI
jgi:hypothetical protein